MKFLKSFILIFTIAIFLGCSNDDDGGGNINASILGTWRATDVDVDGVLTTEFEGQPININFTGEPRNLNYTLTFNEDNSVTANGSFDVDLSASFLGESFDETLENFDPVGTGTWSLSGNNLTITSGGESQTVIIDELSDTLLTLRLTSTENVERDGQEFDATIDSRMFLTKQ